MGPIEMGQQSNRNRTSIDLNRVPSESVDGSQPLVLPLDELARSDLAVAGGKGANLGELIRAGFPVPPGFVVTTASYDRFVAHNHLDETIAQVLHEEPASGATIRGAFEAAPIPPEVERDVVAAYAQFVRGPVAVRSSATAEDLPGAAFAGQQDTYLNIVGTEALLDAVRRCWASLWTDRAIAYRKRQEADQQTVKLAVVVQRMIPAEAAGVMFTANPITGARDEIIIDASPGLGEAVVSGLVTPDHFVLDKRSSRVKERRPGRREVIILARRRRHRACWDRRLQTFRHFRSGIEATHALGATTSATSGNHKISSGPGWWGVVYRPGPSDDRPAGSSATPKPAGADALCHVRGDVSHSALSARPDDLDARDLRRRRRADLRTDRDRGITSPADVC
jgi:hypothetical protein